MPQLQHNLATRGVHSFGHFAVLEQVLTAIDQRLSRPGLLLECLSDLQRLYSPLFEDFQQFYPQLQAFAASERERLD